VADVFLQISDRAILRESRVLGERGRLEHFIAAGLNHADRNGAVVELFAFDGFEGVWSPFQTIPEFAIALREAIID